MSNQDVVDCVWKAATEAYKAKLNIHKVCGAAVTALLHTAMQRGSMDNVSAIVLGFPHFEAALSQRSILTH